MARPKQTNVIPPLTNWGGVRSVQRRLERSATILENREAVAYALLCMANTKITDIMTWDEYGNVKVKPAHQIPETALQAVRRLGDLSPGDFAASGSRTARMTSDLYDGGEGFASSQVDGDTDDAVISFTDGTSTLELTLADAQVAEPVADRISGPGAKTVTVVWASTGNDPLSIELVNANSTAEAA